MCFGKAGGSSGEVKAKVEVQSVPKPQETVSPIKSVEVVAPVMITEPVVVKKVVADTEEESYKDEDFEGKNSLLFSLSTFQWFSFRTL